MTTPYEQLKRKSEDLSDRARRTKWVRSNLSVASIRAEREDVSVAFMSSKSRDMINTILTDEGERLQAEAERINAKLDAVNDLLRGEELGERKQ